MKYVGSILIIIAICNALFFFWFENCIPYEIELFVPFSIVLFFVLINFNKDALTGCLKKIKLPDFIDFIFLIIFFILLFIPLACVCFHTNPQFIGKTCYKYLSGKGEISKEFVDAVQILLDRWDNKRSARP